MFGKKIAAILSTVMIITGSCVPSVVVHAQTGYAAESYTGSIGSRHAEHCKTCCERILRKQCHLPAVFQWKSSDTGKRGS